MLRLLARPLLFPGLVHQVVAALVVGRLEVLPPLGQGFLHLSNVGTQTHEVKACAETGLDDHAKRRVAHALFKAGLHDPDLAHVGGQLAAARHIANAAVKHLVNRILQGRQRMLAAIQALVPALAHVFPQHAGQQEAGRHGLAFLHAAVGVHQGRLHERRVGTFHGHV